MHGSFVRQRLRRSPFVFGWGSTDAHWRQVWKDYSNRHQRGYSRNIVLGSNNQNLYFWQWLAVNLHREKGERLKTCRSGPGLAYTVSEFGHEQKFHHFDSVTHLNGFQMKQDICFNHWLQTFIWGYFNLNPVKSEWITKHVILYVFSTLKAQCNSTIGLSWKHVWGWSVTLNWP